MCSNVLKPNVYYAMPRSIYTKLRIVRACEIWMQVTATTLQWPQQDLLYIYRGVSPKVSSMHNCTWVQYRFEYDLCSYLGHIMPWCIALCCQLFLATIYSINQDLSPLYVFVFDSVCICIFVYVCICISGRGGQLPVCFGGLAGWAWSRRSSPLIRRESWASAQSMPAHSGGPLGHAPTPTPVGNPKYTHPVPLTQKYAHSGT